MGGCQTKTSFVDLPHLVIVRQNVDGPQVDDLPRAVGEQIQRVLGPLGPLAGRTVGITAGSRGIHRVVDILRTAAAAITGAGGRPVLIPAMGSHGEGQPRGRRQILAGLGITPKAVGAEIQDSPAYVTLGHTPAGAPVVCNAAAARVDGLIVFNRIKAHTDFSGRIESGLQKMLVIGLGSHRGCVQAHAQALDQGYEHVIRSTAAVMLAKLPVIGGLAVWENHRGRTAAVRGLTPGEIVDQEPLLLEQAKCLGLKLPFDRMDVLVVGEMGKNVSGTGMDTKIIGRIRLQGQTEPAGPRIGRIVVLSLTPETHGNALGIGLADVTTRRVVAAFNRRATMINAKASICVEHAGLPCFLDHDRQAIATAIRACGRPRVDQVRLVYIQNTMEIEKIAVSTALLAEVGEKPHLQTLGPPQAMRFDAQGNFLNFRYAVAHPKKQ